MIRWRKYYSCCRATYWLLLTSITQREVTPASCGYSSYVQCFMYWYLPTYKSGISLGWVIIMTKWLLHAPNPLVGASISKVDQIYNSSERQLYKWHTAALSQVIAWTAYDAWTSNEKALCLSRTAKCSCRFINYILSHVREVGSL